MANDEHVRRLLDEGVEAWNAWREAEPDILPDLRDADLRDADLRKADLRDANLRRANLRKADLRDADLRDADLSSANLRRANSSSADFSSADLRGTNLRAANLHDANLTASELYETGFVNVDLSTVRELVTCRHHGPSTIDHRTLARSGKLPLAFLRGCGLPDALIEYMPSLLGEAIQYYSSFISYSSADEEFAKRLHADLQAEGVRCWFAPEDMKIGDRLRPRIDQTIRVYDKLLLILSERSIKSQWVEQEVETAIEQEEKGGGTVLFPIRIDDQVMTLDEGWAHYIKRTRNIGNFTSWKEHDAYQAAFERLLRDLKAEDA